jgi:hypothetical protein
VKRRGRGKGRDGRGQFDTSVIPKSAADWWTGLEYCRHVSGVGVGGGSEVGRNVIFSTRASSFSPKEKFFQEV